MRKQFATLIRIATFKTPPPDDREWVIGALRSVPGVRAAYHVVNRETGALLSISICDEAATDAAHAAIARRAAERNHHGVPPDEIRLCEVIRFMDRTVDHAVRERLG